MNDDQPVGLRQRGEHAGLVPRLDAAQVEHLGRHAVGGQGIGGGQGGADGGSVGHDGDVRALAGHAQPAQRDRSRVLRQVPLGGVQRLVLDEDDGVGVVDGGAQKAVGVGGVARADDAQARNVGEPRLQALRVLRPGADARAVGRAQDHRHRTLAAEHEPRLGRLVDDGVHGDAAEVHEHDLDDRLEAADGGADGGTDDGRLGDRRVAHPLRPERVEQATRHTEGTARNRHVLAEQNHVGVVAHSVGKCLADRLSEPGFSHGRPRRANRRRPGRGRYRVPFRRAQRPPPPRCGPRPRQ